MEDFVPWVPPISGHPSDWEEEEEEDEMSDLVHNFAVEKRKRDASFKRVVDAIPEVAGGEVSDVQAIIISGSPKVGLNDQPAQENVTLVGIKGGLFDPCSNPGVPSSRAGFWQTKKALVYPGQM